MYGLLITFGIAIMIICIILLAMNRRIDELKNELQNHSHFTMPDFNVPKKPTNFTYDEDEEELRFE